MNRDLSRYPEVLRDLIDKGSERISEQLGIPMDQAREIAWHITEIIRKDWSGDQIYLPKGLAHDLSLRDREMYRKFNGSNHALLAREYGITVRQVYDRLALVSAEEFRRQQPALFAETG